ncbi:MAG: MFS transporter [Bacilli bacterium]|jgi:MFS family permease|nr:MFS transporter [Bacilli bacterium]
MKTLNKYITARTFLTAANQMLTTATAYQIYHITHNAFYLGLIGLIQFLPKIIFIFQAGTLSDRFDRRKIITLTQTGIFIISLFIVLSNTFHLISGLLLLVCVFIYGSCFALEGPAITSLLPNIVERNVFSKATAQVSSFTQAATILGPTLAGLLLIFNLDFVYIIIALFNLIAIIFIKMIKSSEVKKDEFLVTNESQVKATIEGFKFIWKKKGILGAMSLDMFAVLFGGITALLPMFASEVLHVGSFGYGLLRSAPGIGAIIMAAILVYFPLQEHVGKKMFLCVALFGLITILFALSKIFIISLLLLVLLGMVDQVSVIIRTTYVQLVTPDDKRGRISAVNLIFIGASNQLGEFESGMVAGFLGLIPASIIGGVATLIIVAIWYNVFDDLRELEKL